MEGYVTSARFPELFRYPGSRVWWCKLPNPNGGRHLRKTTGHRDERAAHKRYLELVRQPIEEADQTPPSKSLSDALDDRIAWLKTARLNDDPSRKKPAPDTVSFYEKKSRILVDVLGPDVSLIDIGHETIRKYIAQRSEDGAKATTIQKELITLSLAMKLARKDGVPCAAFRDIKPEDFVARYVPKTRWLAREELDRVLEILPERYGSIVAFCVATGSTFPSEVRNARRGDVNLKTFEVHIRGTKRETRDRTFIVPSDRRDYLHRAMQTAPKEGFAFPAWSNIRRDLLVAAALLSMCEPCRARRNLWWRQDDGTVLYGVQRGSPRRDPKCQACGKLPVFEPFCPTDLRRTFAKWLALAGVPYEIAYPLMGHTDDRMLKQVYGKRSAKDVSPLVEEVLNRKSRLSRG